MDYTPEENLVFQLVYSLTIPDKRANALQELCKIRECPSVSNMLAPILWNSFGIMSTLLQEVINVYPILTSPRIDRFKTRCVCNAVALLQAVAQHTQTRMHFFRSNIIIFLYPLLNTSLKHRSFEYMRLTSLGVIGAIVKSEEPEVINFFLSTELIPLCLRIMENGSCLSKTLATFIIEKILLDPVGLNYVFATPVRFRSVVTLLASMVTQTQNPKQYALEGFNQQRPRLLKHIIRCLLRLTDGKALRDELRKALPVSLVDGSLMHIIRDDVSTTKELNKLIHILNEETEM